MKHAEKTVSLPHIFATSAAQVSAYKVVRRSSSMFVMFSALDFCADDANVVVVARKASNAFRRLHLDHEDDDAE